MPKSTKYSTIKKLENIAQLLGVDLSEVEPLPSLELEPLTLPPLSLDEDDYPGVQGAKPPVRTSPPL